MVRTFLALVTLAVITACSAAPHHPSPDFTLKAQDGTPWQLSAQHGKTVLLFFGYTHCPDTCPVTLAKLTNAIHKANAKNAVVAFVTVDPERDTPPVLAKYVKRFDGPVVGLTGTRPQIEAVERSYHQWAQKIPGKRGNDNYDDAHSSNVFLIDANGNQAGIRDQEDTVDTIAEDLQSLHA